MPPCRRLPSASRRSSCSGELRAHPGLRTAVQWHRRGCCGLSSLPRTTFSQTRSALLVELCKARMAFGPAACGRNMSHLDPHGRSRREHGCRFQPLKSRLIALVGDPSTVAEAAGCTVLIITRDWAGACSLRRIYCDTSISRTRCSKNVRTGASPCAGPSLRAQCSQRGFWIPPTRSKVLFSVPIVYTVLFS